MPTTIAFFDTTAKEKSSFEHYFTGSKFKLLMFNEPIQLVPAYEYKEAQIVSVFTPSHLDSKLLSHLPKLKYIAARSTGVDNIDAKACKKLGIAIAMSRATAKPQSPNTPFYLCLCWRAKCQPFKKP